MRIIGLWISVLLMLFAGCSAQGPRYKTMHLDKSVYLPSVAGRIDHMSIDIKRNRLFVAALGNNSVEVVDVSAGKVIHSIKGLHEPQGVVYIPAYNELFVANGGDGICELFDASNWKVLKKIDLGADADNVRYNPATQHIFVGYGSGGIAIINAKDGSIQGKVPLPAHPESFQFGKSDTMLYVNVPDADQVDVVNIHQLKVVDKWPVHGARGNFPMSIDSNSRRLFIGCRWPTKVLVLNAQNGQQMTNMVCERDADDIYYDAVNKRVYVSTGEGYLDVYAQNAADQYSLKEKIATYPGARTSLFVPSENELFIATPRHRKQSAAILVYKLNMK